MSETGKIWEDAERGLEIRLETLPSDEVVGFLSQTVWGSQSLRYRLPDLGERLRRLRAPAVFTMVRHGRLASVCILDRCAKKVRGRMFDAFHFVMAATADEWRNEGLAGLLIAEIRRFCERELRQPGLGFAYVEATTVFSLRISDRIGHALDCEMPILLFSRLWPSDEPRAGLARPDERDEIVARLEALYRDHELLDFEASVATDRFLVLRDGNEIVAGLQVEELTWSLVSLPGLVGRFVMWLLPRIPFVKGRLDPQRLRLLRFANLLVEPGREAAFVSVLEAALARHNASLSLMMLDARASALDRIRRHGRLGLLSHALRGSVVLRVDFVGVEDDEIAAIAERPLLPSAGDIF